MAPLIPCSSPTSPPLTTNSSKPPLSFVDRTDRLLKSLGGAASDHPLLKPLLSLRSHLRSLFQVHFRVPRVPPSSLVTRGRAMYGLRWAVARAPHLHLISYYLFSPGCLRILAPPLLVTNHNFAAILPGDSVAGLVAANGINSFLNIYTTLLVVRLVLTWFPNSPPAIVSPLSTICDPYLNIFCGIIPPLGGTLDLSPILAFLVLNAFTSAAAALPAELPAPQRHSTSHANALLQNPGSTREKWMRRLTSMSSQH